MRYGREFAPFSQGRYFVASNGFIIASDSPRLACYPRIGKLSLPMARWYDEYQVEAHLLEVSLERAPFNDTYIDFMVEALREYEKIANFDIKK